MNTRELLKVAETRPENLLLAGTDELLAFARKSAFIPQRERCVAAAELAARWCLSMDSGLGKNLEELLGNYWRDFGDWYQMVFSWTRGADLDSVAAGWTDPPDLPGFAETLRRRLVRLFSAQGFIPVCKDAEAWFIPFTLEKERAGALWSDGTGIAVWDDPVREALAGTDFRGIRLQLRPGPEVDKGVEGRSLMLPVRMAALRGKPDGLPAYDVFRVLATGAFDGEFRLEDVKVKAKLDAVSGQFRGGVLFGPADVYGTGGDKEKAFRRLEAGKGESHVLGTIRDELEKMPDCFPMTRDYALRRLPDMAARVDRENHRRWSEVADQLEGIATGVSRERDPETWLEFRSMLATALCHAGRTGESKACTEEALAFARANGFAAKALRLQVTAAVNAQDFGEMDEYRVLADGLEHDLEAFDGPEKDDLLMRFHGTAAQANAFGALHGVEGFTSEAAHTYAGKAVAYALDLARRAGPETRDEAESNLAQDLNYRHLVTAIFEPGTPAEEKAWQSARRQLSELPEKAARNNRYHQMRQRSLAFFNAWGISGLVPDVAARQGLRLPGSDVERWLVAANRRHLGALAAAAGEKEEAEQCFREGEEALPLEKCSAPVLASIRLALLVQAACSLYAAGMERTAEHYAALSAETYGAFRESALFRLIQAEKWMDALRQRKDPRGLPPFYY